MKSLTIFNRVSDSRQRAIMQSVGVEYLSNFPTPFWYYYGKIVANGIYGNEKQLQLLNCIRVRTREFISFTNATFADQKATDKVMPLNVVEVDILKPRSSEPLQLFWKPARGIIIQRVKHCESLPFNCASREPRLCNLGVENLEHLDLSASEHEPKETTSANQGQENTDDKMPAPQPETIT